MEQAQNKTPFMIRIYQIFTMIFFAFFLMLVVAVIVVFRGAQITEGINRFMANRKIPISIKWPYISIAPKVTPTPTPAIVTNKKTKIYTAPENSYAVAYPKEFSLKPGPKHITISNDLLVKFTTMKPSVMEVTNYTLMIEEMTGSEQDVADGLPFESPVNYGGKTFQTIHQGVEGTGVTQYFLKTGDDKWLKISQYFYLDNDVSEEDRKKPEYLTNDKAEQVTKSILASIKVNLTTDPKGQFTCPKSEWVDCMPGIGPAKPMCTKAYLEWAQANCPGFQGAAY